MIGPGQAFHFPPGTVHRLQAIDDTRILEVSTSQLDDVVPLRTLRARGDKRSPRLGNPMQP